MVLQSKVVAHKYTERELLNRLLEQSEKVRTLHHGWWAEKISAHKRDKLHDYLQAGRELDNMIFNIKQLLK